MSYLRDKVIVLKKEPFREQDRRYVMYGQTHGLLSAVARGASIARSKQAGHLELFSVSEVMIAKGVAFDKLAVARGLARVDLFATNGGLGGAVICGAFADLVIRLTRPGIADEGLFELLSQAMKTFGALPEPPSSERARFLYASATLRLLDVLGYAPELETSLLKFMRSAPLADLLRVTATRDVLAEASAFVEEALEQAPLHQEPHGVRTIQAYLG